MKGNQKTQSAPAQKQQSPPSAKIHLGRPQGTPKRGKKSLGVKHEELNEIDMLNDQE